MRELQLNLNLNEYEYVYTIYLPARKDGLPDKNCDHLLLHIETLASKLPCCHGDCHCITSILLTN
jgi:hypothetical protein